jgi:hypothetical protein
MIDKYLDQLPIKEIYKDLLSPGMNKAGEALSTVLDGANLILLPLKLASEKSKIYFKKNIERYSDKLNKNTELTLSKVPQYVGLPIIDKLIYLDQNELAEAFINLLTKASFNETLKLVHPTYISILNNLSADEAKILFEYRHTQRIPFIDIYIHRYIEKIKKPTFSDNGIKSFNQIKAEINYTFQDKEDTYIKAVCNLTGIEKEINLMFPENIDIYIENLNHNGLITFERESFFADDIPMYSKLSNVHYVQDKEKIDTELTTINTEYNLESEVRKGYIKFTELGKGFINACINDLNITSQQSANTK